MPSPVYFPPLANGTITQLPYSQEDRIDNVIVDTDSGKRYAYNRRAAPLGRFILGYTSITDAEVATLEAFFDLMQGRRGDFIFIDPGGNLIPVSEDYADASWVKAGVAIGAPASDPFSGSLATSVSGSGTMTAAVLPDGSAPAYWLTASIWVRSSAPGQTIQVGFWDGTADISAKTFAVPTKWTRISVTMTIATASALSYKLSANFGSGMFLFGAQCSVLPTPGPYVRSPEGWALRRGCRFDTDSFSVRYQNFNSAAVSLPLIQHG